METTWASEHNTPQSDSALPVPSSVALSRGFRNYKMGIRVSLRVHCAQYNTSYVVDAGCRGALEMTGLQHVFSVPHYNAEGDVCARLPGVGLTYHLSPGT